MIQIDRQGTPVAIDTASASRNEVILIEPLLEKTTMQNEQSERLVYDKAADSDGLRDRLYEQEIDLICPHHKLRRYKRRWIVERTIAWLNNYRRIVTRWEYHEYLYESFVILGCLFTLLKRF
tara:strand:+ start:1227 stop:1592 length:366 start_codon:yes stop_codon:yes gene_type:complete